MRHNDNDGCAIYAGEHVVQVNGEDVFVSDLENEDIFNELGDCWLVSDITQVGEEFHLNLEGT